MSKHISRKEKWVETASGFYSLLGKVRKGRNGWWYAVSYSPIPQRRLLVCYPVKYKRSRDAMIAVERSWPGRYNEKELLRNTKLKLNTPERAFVNYE